MTTTTLALIFVLVGHRSPSAIFRAIWSFVVDSIKGVAIGALPHICDEIQERSSPSFTDANAPAAVMRVVKNIRVFTSLFHCVPSVIEQCLGKAVSQVIGFVCFQTSTTSGFSVSQIGAKNNGLCAAFTNAPIFDFAKRFFDGQQFYYSPALKDLTDKRNRTPSSHGFNCIIFSYQVL
jgi:hypothetical protein